MTDNLRYSSGASLLNSYGGYYLHANTVNACPTGWSLPSNSAFEKLKSEDAYPANNTLLSFPFSAAMTGYVSGGTLSRVGNVAFYYGLEQINANSSYYFSIRTQGTDTPNLTADGRTSEAMNVRCSVIN